MEEIGCGATSRPLLIGNVGPSPEVVILEQPAPRTLRFRYECEGRLAGCLTGINSTPENKTFPTIQVRNYQDPAIVIVSCVTKDAPYYPHPHRIVGKEGCKDGIYTTEIRSPDMIQSFTGLGIQCVKKKDVEASLIEREAKKVDPFRTGFDHKMQPSSIDLNVVRLCFQVILLTKCRTRKYMLKPIVSNPIYDKKAHSDLSIHKLSHYTAPVSGGTEVILLCEKVNKDVQIKFFEKKGDQEVWKEYAKFQPNDIHKQVAISFRTPPYHDVNVSHEVDVWIQLERPSDRSVGVPRKFQFLPVDRDPESLARKRVKFEQGCYDDYIRSTFGPGVTGNQEGVIHVPREQRLVKFRAKHRASGASPMVCPSDYKMTPPAVPHSTNVPTVNPMMPFPASQFRTDGMPVARYPMPPMRSIENVASSKLNRDMVNIPPAEYQRTDDSNHLDFQMRPAISVASVPFSGGTLIHSFPSNSVNNLGQKLPVVAQNNCIFPPNVPPLSDESNSSPPSPASLLVAGTSGLQQNTDKFDSELQMSVEDATEKFGSLTVDPNELQLPSDASFSGTDWHYITPTFQCDSVLDFMVAEGGHNAEIPQQAVSEGGHNAETPQQSISESGHTAEILQQVKKIQRELVELCENTKEVKRHPSECDEQN